VSFVAFWEKVRASSPLASSREMDANSFYSSAVAAGVTDSLISDFANAFTFDFDFQREIKPGDIFEAAFEQQVNDAGDTAGTARLVYASLQTQAKSRALYRFTPPGESKAAWFDGNGSSVARSLMRTPVEGARITSSFGPRMHWVLVDHSLEPLLAFGIFPRLKAKSPQQIHPMRSQLRRGVSQLRSKLGSPV